MQRSNAASRPSISSHSAISGRRSLMKWLANSPRLWMGGSNASWAWVADMGAVLLRTSQEMSMADDGTLVKRALRGVISKAETRNRNVDFALHVDSVHVYTNNWRRSTI